MKYLLASIHFTWLMGTAQYQMNSMGRGGMQSGYCPDGLHPNPNDCQSFYNCAHGQQYQQQCGPGTVFNPYNQVCDWPNPSICQDYSTCAPCYGSQGQGYYGGSSIDNQYSGYAPGESQAYGQQNYGPDYTQNYWGKSNPLATGYMGQWTRRFKNSILFPRLSRIIAGPTCFAVEIGSFRCGRNGRLV